jgi:hypothetical protein
MNLGKSPALNRRFVEITQISNARAHMERLAGKFNELPGEICIHA